MPVQIAAGRQTLIEGMMKFGIDRLMSESRLQEELAGRALGLVANAASLTANLDHAMDAVATAKRLRLVAAFGPQHGMRGDKQDNMVESDDYLDPVHQIPVYSLYGRSRRPTDAMLEGVELVLFDLQALGCRIYTYVTTLKYFLEACARNRLPIWVLDRPNPAGRSLDGSILQVGAESFVGCDEMIMRYGLTLGELANWLVAKNQLDVDLKVVTVSGYDPLAAPGYGWPIQERSWVNPSPNASSLNMARCFAGTVLIEGTTLSEGRGTTTPLEVIGAPGLDARRLLADMEKLAPAWMQGALLRPCYFEPGYHKHGGRLCQGIQLHTDNSSFRPEIFKPYRLVALVLKAIRQIYPDYDLWRAHEYEYESDRLAIDVIDGGARLRTWVDDQEASVADLEQLLQQDERSWREVQQTHLLY